MFIIMKKQVTSYTIPFGGRYVCEHACTHTHIEKRWEGHTEMLGTSPVWKNLVFNIFNLLHIYVF